MIITQYFKEIYSMILTFLLLESLLARYCIVLYCTDLFICLFFSACFNDFHGVFLIKQFCFDIKAQISCQGMKDSGYCRIIPK